jgi:single-strand DNA-binding protein
MQRNRVEVAGYLGKDAQARYLPTGTKVVNLRLAESYIYTDRNKAKQEHTNWHNVVCYGVVADVAERLAKGDNVFVDGSLQIREFEPNDGSKRRRVVEVVARSVALIARIPGLANAENDQQSDDDQDPEALNTQPEVDDETAEVWPS